MTIDTDKIRRLPYEGKQGELDAYLANHATEIADELDALRKQKRALVKLLDAVEKRFVNSDDEYPAITDENHETEWPWIDAAIRARGVLMTYDIDGQETPND